MKQTIQLGHSPDSDDAFMFFGLAKGYIDTGNYQFQHILKDIQTLNEWALQGRLEVTAVSVHAYAYLQDKYAVLTSGASMGATELATYEPDQQAAWQQQLISLPNNPTGVHGPLLISAEPITLEQARGKTIAIPGKMTSAFLTLQMILGEFDYIVMDFDEIEDAVRQNRAQAGLIIHEGQLTAGKNDLHCLLDLGQWWFDRTALPLPLGCNIIRKDLGRQALRDINRILRESVQYSLTHRQEAVDYALQFGRGLSHQHADQFIGMYVNHWTVDYGPVGRKALTEFLRQGHQKGFTPPTQLHFADD